MRSKSCEDRAVVLSSGHHAVRNFLSELRARGVLKIATAYLALSWLTLEIGHTLFQIFELPQLGLRAIFVLLVLGFPVALAYAWYSRIAAKPGEQAAATSPNESPQIAIVFAVVAVLAIAVAIGVRFFGFGGEHRKSGSDAVVAQAKDFRPPAHSVAVLSFVNLSGDPKEDYFSDGLSEELLHVLTRVEGLRVAARTSSFSFKSKDVDIPTVGRRLNVGAVLEGSVRKSGERVRITAQLINAITGFHFWSHTYDREIKDILALQTEIASAVAGALEITLLANTGTLAVGGTRNAQAYDAYLRGRYGESVQDEAGLRTSLAALDEAIALDPNYAKAQAFRADVLMQISGMYTLDPKEKERLNAEARASADKAVKMAPKLGLAHSTLGTVLASTTSDYAAIDAAYKRSIALEPNNAELLLGYASYAALFGRPDALAAAKRVVSLDPLRVGAQANLGVVLFYARRHDEAAAAFREAARLGNNRLNINWMGQNELAAGRPDAALPLCERDPDFWYDQVCLAMTYHALKRPEDATRMLKRMQAAQGDGAAYQYAEVYAMWGETGEALKWLTKAVELGDGGLLAIKTDPFLDPLRKLPEFQAIVSKLDLPS
jgi:adenylate cyclase